MTNKIIEILRFPYTTLFRSHGDTVVPSGSSDVPQMDNSGHRVLPSTLAPAWRRAATNGSSSTAGRSGRARLPRSEEHTSELQSRGHLVCRLLLEKKKKKR